MYKFSIFILFILGIRNNFKKEDNFNSKTVFTHCSFLCLLFGLFITWSDVAFKRLLCVGIAGFDA